MPGGAGPIKKNWGARAAGNAAGAGVTAAPAAAARSARSAAAHSRLTASWIWISRRFRHVLMFLCQAEDGIRDAMVTGVQTCALPIFGDSAHEEHRRHPPVDQVRPQIEDE